MNVELSKLTPAQRAELFEMLVAMGRDPVACMETVRVPQMGIDQWCWTCGTYYVGGKKACACPVPTR